MSGISDKVMEQIKKEGIVPTPRWHFLLRRSVIWVFAVVSLLLGSVASGILFYEIRFFEWDLFRHYRDGFFEAFLTSVPLIWIAFLGVFLVLTWLHFRRTPRGYRLRGFHVFSISLIVSLLLGWGLSTSGFSAYLDRKFNDSLPAFNSWQSHRLRMWMSPERGLLVGTIMNRAGSENEFLYRDIDGAEWIVDANRAFWRGNTSLQPGARVRLVGRLVGAGRFIADEVRPWPGEGRRMFRGFAHPWQGRPQGPGFGCGPTRQ